jgi:hypothetical protein
MREHFADRALESRFLTEETGQRDLRSDIAIHLPPSCKEEARALRNRLLAWRFAARDTIATDPTRAVAGVAPRFNQAALALLSIVDDATVRDRIAAMLVVEDARVASERAQSPEAVVLRAMVDLADRTPGAALSIGDITEAVSRNSSGNSQISVSAKSIGWVIRTKLRLPTVKSRGVFVIPALSRPAISALAARYGMGMRGGGE